MLLFYQLIHVHAMKRATIKISLDTNPSSQYSDGSYPVVLQIGHNRRIFRKRTGLKAIPKEWDNERYVSDKRVVRNYKERNDELNELEYKANGIISTHFSNSFDYKYFSKLLEQDSEECLLLGNVAQDYIDELYSQERAGTAMYYECVLSSLKSYKEIIPLEQVNRNWIKEYVKYNTMRGVKCISYLRGLKAIFGYAIKEYDLDYKVMPFKTAYQPKGYNIADAKKIKVRKLPPKNGRLIKCFTEEELATIKNYKPDNDGKARAYALFMFSYYTGGVNAKDIALMKYEDIRNGIWYYKREKDWTRRRRKAIV